MSAIIDLFGEPSVDLVDEAIAGRMKADALSDEQLVAALVKLNAAYRRNEAITTDARYDFEFLAELRKRNPEHPYLTTPEPEPEDAFGGEQYRHTVPMLSIEKGYTDKDVAAWVMRVRKAALGLGLSDGDVRVRVTAKLDGNSVYDYGDQLVTRGSNGVGRVVTSLLDKGVVFDGGVRGGACELVIAQSYFAENLAGDFEHPRNLVAGISGADDPGAAQREALDAGAVRLVAYSTLAGVELSLDALQERWSEVMDQVQDVDYLCDGAVVEVVDLRLRQHMGATGHSHRWMLALKRNDVVADAEVLAVSAIAGRTGRIVPVLELAPVKMAGCTISRVTAHTTAHLAQLGLGAGAIISLTRSGAVIPAIVSVVRRADVAAHIDACPSCGGPVEQRLAHLYCTNTFDCPAQGSRSLEHYFRLTGVRGFGPSVTAALQQSGITDVRAVYGLTREDFVAAGVGAGVAANLMAELARSREVTLEDAVFLAAFGIPNLGRGDSRRLLRHVAIDSLDTLTADVLRGIDGFGELTSGPIVAALQARWPLIRSMLDLGFNLLRTPMAGAGEAGNSSGPLQGQVIVFTGSMVSGSRDDMEAGARSLGASVGGSVSGKTTLLVTGEKVGASKTDKAAKLGVKVITEAEYLSMIAR